MGFIEFMSSFIFAGPRVRGAERRREREGETEAVIGIFFSPTQAVYGLLIELFASTDPESNGGIDKRRGIVPGKQR